MKIVRETHTMAPSYEQNKAKIGEIHCTVNLGFKRPVHEGCTTAYGTTHHRVHTPHNMPQPAKHPTNNPSCQTTQPLRCVARKCAQEPPASSALFARLPKPHHLVWLKSVSGPITTCLRPFWWQIFTFVRNGPFVTTKPRDIRQLASECSQIMAGVYYTGYLGIFPSFLV